MPGHPHRLCAAATSTGLGLSETSFMAWTGQEPGREEQGGPEGRAESTGKGFWQTLRGPGSLGGTEKHGGKEAVAPAHPPASVLSHT